MHHAAKLDRHAGDAPRDERLELLPLQQQHQQQRRQRVDDESALLLASRRHHR